VAETLAVDCAFNPPQNANRSHQIMLRFFWGEENEPSTKKNIVELLSAMVEVVAQTFFAKNPISGSAS
jgi:hypothetical protein